MKTRSRILTGSALGLLLAAAPLALAPSAATAQSAGILVAQAAEKPEGMTEEAWRALMKKRQGGESEEPPEAEAPAPEAAPEPETVPEPEPAPEAAPESEPAPEPRAEEPAAPQTEPAPPAAEEPARQAEPPAEAPVPELPAAEEPATEPEAEQPPAEEPATEPPVEAPATETPVEEPATDAPAEPDEPTRQPAGEPEAETTTPAEEQPADAGEQPPAEQTPPPVEEATEESLPENAAPVLDSRKEAPADGATPEDTAAPAEGEAATGQPAPAEEEAAAPPPATDAEAQAETFDPEAFRSEIRDMVREEGRRIEMGTTREERRQRRRALREPREGARIVKEFNDNRTIVEIDNQVFVESPDSDRMVRDDDEVYYEELPRGRVREVVVRPNGVRLITVRDRYGDVIRRVRVGRDGREQVLVFVPDERLDSRQRWRDPAMDLPPLRLAIPVSEYILEAEHIEDPDRYYAFLQKPPVEPVRRLYSLEEVKRSARVRDMVRRVDLDTIEFAFGSADIEEGEIDALEAIADAIERMLAENPAETFLIEGHTDAVGSDLANLALSDRRAESVARALTDVFGIPPENLVTQGYGERYLKIDTQARERENRRVALRRITPLVAPVASAE